MTLQNMRSTRSLLAGTILAIAGGIAAPTSTAEAQGARSTSPRLAGQLVAVPPPAASPSFRSREDSLAWDRARQAAHRAPGERLIIDLFERRLSWVDGADTLFVAQVAVGSGDTLSYRNQAWRFDTPRGRRVIRAMEENPVWVPPLWHYVGHARKTGRGLTHLQEGRPVRLSDGSKLVVRGDRVGRLDPDGDFHPVPRGDHVIFDDTVFVPPFGTVNRQIVGELGRFKLDLGNGYLIHGTPHKDSIGEAATHGCIRVGDEELEFLYRSVRVGLPVYIY
jgi:hypothetical protein